ncbi:GTPase HflX [Macrococcus armenti]|uniref:GTPase HflX n=1 Tax=Macrococcus armenti TaxID=2875764 RepID=UPI001CCFA1F6|nr:GTPase HflX [Macrococcus armenti]UBH09609.1 GTPase HflX [Macrococcus armenti]UBH11884.1 GTPase HflX [Macrococcus armenti]UBH16360.1 GTPase HflX [Macrococcus armenti]UBH18716.1 GTPase HflX [Macrococcus armenti]UBH20988.1 GTPase HflX [Macrococcus armenti]
MKDTNISIERALIIAVHLKKDDEFNFNESVNELKSLCETAGLNVTGEIIQNKDRTDNQYYLGKGKVEEIVALREREDMEFDIVVVNSELTTSQSKHLNEVLDCKIIDRTQLILDIFAQRAKSREGKLQVELAQLEYLLPRLSGHGLSLSRLGGGIGTRGPGETKLEMNRRHIRSRIHDIKLQLEIIKQHRKRYRENRKKRNVFQVALVGYTNAGKSSWFNALSDSETYMEDLLFATLDPKSKMMKLHEGYPVLLSDTVGFIQQLPTHLIEAFSSTLEEAKYADILIHVVDRSHPNYLNHIDTVLNLLKNLDMEKIPMLTLLNKKDKIDAFVSPSGKDQLVVSVYDNDDQQHIHDQLIKMMQRLMKQYTIQIQDDAGQWIAYLKENTLTTDVNYNEITNMYEVFGYEHEQEGIIDKLLRNEHIKRL